MASILLTLDNIDFVKSELRKAIPAAKSAHLTEALAFGAGYNTHAAMLVSIRGCARHRPILAKLDDDRIAARLAALGNHPSDAVSTVALVRSPALPERIWVEFRNGNINANNYWFLECRNRDIPNLRISRRTKYVKLNWDCISLDGRSEAHVMGDSGSALGKTMFKTYQGIARRIPGKSFLLRFELRGFRGLAIAGIGLRPCRRILRHAVRAHAGAGNRSLSDRVRGRRTPPGAPYPIST